MAETGKQIVPYELVTLLQNLIVGKFYGELVVKFEHGKIVHCKKTESIKLQSN
uniref:DUF2292 domain-containing protein n=1 Tax=viral metagenome TaxID=1070528 RepID=A0A6M3KHS5_9ZZZZ